MTVTSLPFAGAPNQAGRARDWLNAQLNQISPRLNSDRVGDAVLVVSELATNAIQAGCSHFTIALTDSADHIRIEVTDDAPGMPVLVDAVPAATHGRGLPIVDALSTDWGYSQSPDGKQIWATLHRT